MNEVVLILLLLAIGFVLKIIFKRIKLRMKGASGEKIVAWKLSKLGRKKYNIINNVQIKSGGRTSQIDHIVVSAYGIFVIETKHYAGWIFGHEKAEYWTQTIFAKKTKFRNPVKKNWGHIYHLKQKLSEYQEVPYYPIIVFVGRVRLKKITSEVPVIYNRQLIRTIKRHSKKPILTADEISLITEKINELNIRDRRGKRDHVRFVKRTAKYRKRSEKQKVCPYCGGDLILRKGKYGKFYGCGNYPKCKYKRSISSR